MLSLSLLIIFCLEGANWAAQSHTNVLNEIKLSKHKHTQNTAHLELWTNNQYGQMGVLERKQAFWIACDFWTRLCKNHQQRRLGKAYVDLSIFHGNKMKQEPSGTSKTKKMYPCISFCESEIMSWDALEINWVISFSSSAFFPHRFTLSQKGPSCNLFWTYFIFPFMVCSKVRGISGSSVVP